MTIDIQQLSVSIEEVAKTVEIALSSLGVTMSVTTLRSARAEAETENQCVMPTLWVDFNSPSQYPVYAPTISAPGGLALASTAYVNADGSLFARLVATWADVSSLYGTFDGYLVELEDDAGNTSEYYVVTNKMVWQVKGDATYKVRVKLLLFYGISSAWSSYVTTTTASNPSGPETPTNLTATPLALSILFRWNHSGAVNLDYFILYRNTVNTFSTASRVLQSVRDFNPLSGMLFYTPEDADDYYYWITGVDKTGQESDPSNSVLTGINLITESELWQTLNERIDLIDAPGTGLWERLEVTETDLASTVESLNIYAALTDDNVAAIAQEIIARTDGDSALAESIETVQTTVGDHTTSIEVNASSIDGIQGKYTVKIDNNGYITGYGLISTNNNGTPTSEFLMLVDSFKIASPGLTPNVPFVVDTVGGNPVVGINGELIVDGTVTANAVGANTIISSSANIGNLTVNSIHINDGEVGTVKVDDNAITSIVSATNNDTIVGDYNGDVVDLQAETITLDVDGDLILFGTITDIIGSGDTLAGLIVDDGVDATVVYITNQVNTARPPNVYSSYPRTYTMNGNISLSAGTYDCYLRWFTSNTTTQSVLRSSLVAMGVKR